MKNKKKMFLIIFTFLFLSLAITIRADSGWDGSYDSGGSWDSGSSWNSGSSWDSGSSWSGGSHSSSGSHYSGNSSLGSMLVVYIIIIFIIIFVIISKSNKNIMKNKPSKNINDVFYEVPYSIDNIKKVLPDFNLDTFRVEIYEIYKKIQVAWMNFDYETIEKYTTNELYNLYKSELTALNLKKQQNIMEDFELLDFSLFNIEKGTKDISIKVRMKISCKDYVVDSNKKVIRGNKNSVVYDYEMTFTKGLSTKDNKCPNCNAPLENNVTSTCPYCDSVVISDNHDWVLSKKRVISQRRK